MTEKQRIIKVLEKHRAYFENVKEVDVALSMKGKYLFYEYNEKYDEYTIITKFSSPEELEQIIEENIATDYCVNLQNVMETSLQVLSRLAADDKKEPPEKIPDLNRKKLVDAFVAFMDVIENTHEAMRPFIKWVYERGEKEYLSNK